MDVCVHSGETLTFFFFILTFRATAPLIYTILLTLAAHIAELRAKRTWHAAPSGPGDSQLPIAAVRVMHERDRVLCISLLAFASVLSM